MKIFVFEGPTVFDTHGKAAGFRHYQVMRGGRADSFVSRPERARATAQTLNAKFFAAGTWEDEECPAKERHFPCPRAEILAELHGAAVVQPELVA